MWWLIEAPARLIGSLAAPLLGIVALVAAIGAGVGIGRLLELYTPASWSPDVRRALSIALGVAVFAYVGVVLWEAQRWMAFSTLHAVQ